MYRHSSIKFATTEQRRNGETVKICEHRDRVYEQARELNQRRWKRSTLCSRQPEVVLVKPPPHALKENPRCFGSGGLISGNGATLYGRHKSGWARRECNTKLS